MSLNTILIIIAIIFVVVIGVLVGNNMLGYYPRVMVYPSPTILPIARSTSISPCLGDMKQCPDGSYVGRRMPSCDFSLCPGNEPQTNTQLIDCDSSLHCEKGYICFEKGYGQGCSKGQDCSKIVFKEVGDNKCHKECTADTDCGAEQKCIFQQSWHGDAGLGGKMCVVTPIQTQSVETRISCGGPRAVYTNMGCPDGYHCGNLQTIGGESSGLCIKN